MVGARGAGVFSRALDRGPVDGRDGGQQLLVSPAWTGGMEQVIKLVTIAREALDCGDAAEGNGTNLLYRADAKGDELKGKYG